MARILCVDSREQKWEHVRDGFDRLDIPWVRSKLYAGDYAWIDDMSVVVDRKQNLQEVYGNLIRDHERFRAEAQRAKDAGIRLIVLVGEPGMETLEDVYKWKNKRLERWQYIHNAHMHGKMLRTKIAAKPPVSSETLAGIMQSMADKYGLEWRFCKPEDTAETILKLLEGSA